MPVRQDLRTCFSHYNSSVSLTSHTIFLGFCFPICEMGIIVPTCPGVLGELSKIYKYTQEKSNPNDQIIYNLYLHTQVMARQGLGTGNSRPPNAVQLLLLPRNHFM